jgi:hypothetical protein
MHLNYVILDNTHLNFLHYPILDLDYVNVNK